MSQDSSLDIDDSVAGHTEDVQTQREAESANPSFRKDKLIINSTSLLFPLGVIPSMMEMCTALGRVLGTLVERGPWVMDGQLLLGTMPALRDTQAEESVETLP